jgi:hypothetical protein
MKNFHLLIFLFLSVLSCNDKDDCEDYLCFTPPPYYGFLIVDSETGENLFTNGTFQASQIKVVNSDTQENLEFSFISENDANILEIPSIGWETEKVNVTVKIGNEFSFNFYVDAERKNGNCCSFTKINEFTITNTAYEIYENNRYAAKILVDIE